MVVLRESQHESWPEKHSTRKCVYTSASVCKINVQGRLQARFIFNNQKAILLMKCAAAFCDEREKKDSSSLLFLMPWNQNVRDFGDDITYSPQDSIFRNEKKMDGDGKKTDFTDRKGILSVSL